MILRINDHSQSLFYLLRIYEWKPWKIFLKKEFLVQHNMSFENVENYSIHTIECEQSFELFMHILCLTPTTYNHNYNQTKHNIFALYFIVFNPNNHLFFKLQGNFINPWLFKIKFNKILTHNLYYIYIHE